MKLLYKTHLCLIVCLMLWLMLHNSESSVQIIFSSNGSDLRKSLTFLNDQVFYSFFNCMVDKYKECTGYYKIMFDKTLFTPVVYETGCSDEKQNIQWSYYYKCELFYSEEPYCFICKSRRLYGCQNFVENCFSDNVGFVLNTNLAYIQGDNINNCTHSCSFRTFYTKSIKSSTIISTNITTTTLSKQITLSSTDNATTNSTYESTTVFSLTTIDRNTDLQTLSVTLDRTTISSTFFSNNSDNSTTSTITISVSVAGVVVIIIVSIIVFFLWRREKTVVEKSDKVKNNKHNSKSFNESGSQFSSITKEENKPPDLLKSGHEAVVHENNSSFILDDCTTIAEVREYSIKLEQAVLNQTFGVYINVHLIHNSIPNVLNYENIGIKAHSNDDQDNDNQCKKDNVEYYNSVDTASSDYQRLGQERRDLKNHYDQLPPLFKEQQLVLSDQELSPYTLDKPVLGEATLQIIDVGARAYNSCDAERASIDSSYHNTR